ncbi:MULTISPECIES: alpha/beta hydrolase [unclassified Nocardiopsis]|uniref:poly(ethylene terephthalate) hydrolase family protein n=1 Tax=unclassified Nocardiopsis TaxID=2649073 RepID=UPI0013570A33|nr:MULTISPECIES: alpha/beta hydrolase [unclassified Nocardiopsis]
MGSPNLFRRASAALFGLLMAAAVIPASPASADVQTMGGTGPYDAEYVTTLRLRNHTVYRPVNLPAGEQLPIVAWGNGACRADGTWFENILTEFASHGFLVIANGRPGGTGSTDAEMLTEAIDWAVAENTRLFSPYRGRLDTGSIAVMGQSCGGLETYEVADDPRIDTTVLWNSGLLTDRDNHLLTRLHAPIAYFTGGPGDIAYANAVDDYGRLPRGLPAFMGHLDVGHFGTFAQPNGGEYGRVGVAWLKWQLKGDQQARQQFVGPDCGLCSTEWDVQSKNLT